MKGQITVFVSAILLLLVSILCSVFEFSRQWVLEFYLDCATDATTESCLAGYEKKLWEEYGILSMYDDGSVEKFMEENLAVYGDFGQNWYPFRVTGTGFYAQEKLCDKHGLVFRQMAVSYMKAGLGDGKTETSAGELTIERGLAALQALEGEYGHFTVNFDPSPKEEEETEKQNALASVTNRLNSLKNGTVSTLVFPGVEFSERVIEQVWEETALEEGEKLQLADGTLFKLYLCEKFPTLLDDASGYDMEYILGTHSCDKENLLEVAGQLLLIREGVNLRYLSSSDLRQAEMLAAAVALAGFLGQPELIRAFKYFIMVSWAFAEAVSDVKTLVNGGKVPLQKNNRNWHTDLESLLFGKEETPMRGSDSGLSYRDYLRILLLLEKEERAALRALEVMQIRLREDSPGFLITRCVTGAKYEIHAEADWFFQTPFIHEKVKNMTRCGEIAYE